MSELLLIVLLLFVSAFFSATETAFFALRRIDLLRWKEEGKSGAGLVERLLSAPGTLITTIFIGNEISNVAISALFASLLVGALPAYGEAAATAAATLSVLVLSDLVPKTLVWPRARGFALAAARPFRLFQQAVAPVRILVEGAAKAILALLGGGRPSPSWGVLSEREFRAMVDVGEEAGTLDAREKRLIHNIFELTEQRAGEVMTPLADVLMVPAEMPWEALLVQIGRYRRSRIPVYEGSRGNVVGILYAKGLLPLVAEGAAGVDWRAHVVPPFAVPAAKKLPLLLRDFQQRKIHLALVVDEHGEVAGIITLEDVLEELFGEIVEEHDRERAEIVELPGGRHRILGKTPVHRFNEAFGTSLPDEEWDTVAGLLLHAFGRLPARGDAIVLSGFRFVVERLKGIRIVGVTVEPVGSEPS